MEEEFYIGQIFENEYPIEAAAWCNESQKGSTPCYIGEIELLEGKRRFQIVKNPEPTEQEIKDQRIAELEAYLASTDWYAARYAETGVEIPEEVRRQRQEAREEISRLREGMAQNDS